MRALIAIAILGGFTGLAVLPAEAGSGVASRGGFGHFAGTSHARLQIVSVQGRKAIIVNRVPRRLAQRGFSQNASFGSFDQFGRFNRFGRFNQFVGDGFFGLDGGVVGASPSVIVVPQPVAASAPARAAVVADLPPCREMMAGVLVQRGTACRAASQ